MVPLNKKRRWLKLPDTGVRATNSSKYRLQKLPGGLIAGVARGVRSQKIKPPGKNLEIIRFFKRREILVISLVFQSKILSCIQLNIYSNSVWV